MSDERCKESVHDGGRMVTFHRCINKAIKDGYCKIHHPDSVAARRDKAAERYEEKMRKERERRERWSGVPELRAEIVALKEVVRAADALRSFDSLHPDCGGTMYEAAVDAYDAARAKVTI